MSEIVIEQPADATIIEFIDGTVVESTVAEEVVTVVSTPSDPLVVDLNSGPRGEPGDRIYNGTGYPPSDLGGVNDLYIITAPPGGVGDIYRKDVEGWKDAGNIRGPAGGIDTVNGYTGPNVVITATDLGLNQVNNTDDLDKPVSTATQTALDLKANDNVVVKLSGNQTVAGVKTFSSAPLVPDSAFAIIKINGLQAALDSKSAVGHTHAIADTTGLSTALASKEPNIAVGSATQYWRGDKTWQTLNPAAVGLGNVTNDAQVKVAGDQTVSGNKTFSGTIIVPLPTADNHAANKLYIDTAIGNLVASAPGLLDTLDEIAAALGDDPNFAATMTTQLAGKEPTIVAGTATQYWRGDKTWQTLDKSSVGLSNIVNVAMVEVASTQTITGAKTFSIAPVVPDSSFAIAKTTGLQSALDSKVSLTGDQSVAGIKTFSSAPVVPDSSFAIVKVSGLQAALDLKANLAGPTFTGTVTAGTFSGSGASLTALNGTQVTTGTIADARLSTNVSLLNVAQTITGAKTFSSASNSFTGVGTGLTALNGSNISSGLVGQTYIRPNVMRVEHGAITSIARPTGATYVEWVGTVQPTNMATGDTWINTSTSGTTTDNTPSGTVAASASTKTIAPTGWYWMEGQEILISTDTALYNELTNNATTFPYGANTNGSGAAGSTHFRLPNGKGKTIHHADATVKRAANTTPFAAVGQTGGVVEMTLSVAQMPSHNHTVSDPGHTHFFNGNSTTWTWVANNVLANGGVTNNFYMQTAQAAAGVGPNNELVTHSSVYNATRSGTTGITTIANGSSSPHDVLQPYITLRWMIKR